jgi:hypothetical protein
MTGQIPRDLADRMSGQRLAATADDGYYDRETLYPASGPSPADGEGVPDVVSQSRGWRNRVHDEAAADGGLISHADHLVTYSLS